MKEYIIHLAGTGETITAMLDTQGKEDCRELTTTGSAVEKVCCPNGDTYECKFKGGYPISGRKTYADGIMFEGIFKGGVPAEGKVSFPEGGVFEGIIEDGWQKEGKFFYDGDDVFEGTFKDGYPSEGVLTYSSGEVFEGRLEMGELAYGKLILPEEGTYEGNFFCSNRDGWGIMRYLDGSIYEGEWVDDQRCGNGKITYPDGTVETIEDDWTKDFPVIDLSDEPPIIVDCSQCNGSTSDNVHEEEADAASDPHGPII